MDKRPHPGNFPDSVVNDALNLFLQGYSAEKISRELKGNGHNVSPSIIRKWSVKFDWKSKRASIQQEKISRVVESSLDDITQIKNQTRLMLQAGMSSILDNLGNAIVSPKSLEGMMVAMKQLHTTLIALEKDEREKFNPSEFIRLIYEAMLEVKELSEAMSLPGVRDRFFKILKNKTEQRLSKEIVIG